MERLQLITSKLASFLCASIMVDRQIMGCFSTKNDDLDLVELGFCVRPHGIKGGLQFVLANTQDSILCAGKEIVIRPKNDQSQLNGDGLKVKIRSIGFGNKVICYLEGHEDRDQIEKLIPFKIFVERKEFPEISQDEFYVRDLIGFSCHHFESGEYLGEVKNIYENGVQMILVVTCANETWELPFVDVFFPVVEWEFGIIKMNPPQVVE